MAYDPFNVDVPLDDPAAPEGSLSRGAMKVADSIGSATKADPLKSEISLRSQRKADFGRMKQAVDQLEETFLSTEGDGLFAKDEKGKPFKNPDGTYVPDMGAKVESLRQRSLGKVGTLRGALTTAVAGDPTDDAMQAQTELSQIEPLYEAKRQKWQRIQEQRARLTAASDQNEMELGVLASQRLANNGAFAEVDAMSAQVVQPAPAAVQPAQAPAAQPAQPTEDPTFLGEFGKNAKDLGASFGSGSNALLKMAGDLYGLASGDFENWMSEQGKYGMDYFERMKSPEMLAKQEARKAAIDAAPDELGKAWAFIKSTVTDPMLFASAITEQVPNTIGTGGAGAVVRKGAEKLLLRKAATEAAQSLALKKAGKLGVAAAVGAGAAMQGADVGGDQYGTLLVEMERMTKTQLEQIPEIAELTKRGASIDEAKMAYALTQARKTGLVAGAISLGAQALPGGSTIERTLAGGAAGRSVRGRLASAAIGGVGEAISESIEEGGGVVASNVFAQGVDPNRKLTQGVGEAVGQAIVTAGPMGAVSGAVNGGSDPETQGSVVPGNPNNIPPLAQPIPVNPPAGQPAAPPAGAVPPGAPVPPTGSVPIDPELQAELDLENAPIAPPAAAPGAPAQPTPPVVATSVPSGTNVPPTTNPTSAGGSSPQAPAAPISTQGGPDAQAGLIRQSSVGSTPTPASTQPAEKPVSPFKVSSPEVKSAWMEGPPADETKMDQIRDGFNQPGVKLGYSVFDGAPGKPRALQIDAIDANGESMVSSNIYDLARAGIEVPIPPADLKPGTYTREQIEQALGNQAPTTTQASGDVAQSPQTPQSDVPPIAETTEAKPKYDKSSTQVTLPEEQAKPFREFAASIAEEDVYTEEGDSTFGRETEPHITALYGIENDDVDAVKAALADVGPIKVMLGEVSSFENADKPYDVLKVDVNSPVLRKVNAALKKGTKNSSDFPDYKPHLTIGYVKKGTAKKYVGDDRFQGQPLTFDTLQFRTRDGRSIDIPLTGSTTSPQTKTPAPDINGVGNTQKSQDPVNPPGGAPSSNGNKEKVPTEAPQGEVGGSKPAPGVRPGAGTSVGVNSDGASITADENGVRSITAGGITRTEPVQLTPTRAPNGGVVYVAKPADREGTEFETAEERQKREGSKAKGPAITRGANTPQKFAQVAQKASGLAESDTGSKFLRDFAPRLQKANPEAFANMEVHVLSNEEWKAHPTLSQSNPDAAAVFNVRNILYLNSDKVQGGQKIAEAIVHEAGHFAEMYALGEKFTQQQWESLTDEQRQDAAKSYDWKNEQSGAELKNDRRARAEWVAMQFTRIITGDSASMDATMKEKLEGWLKIVRELVQQWLGNKRYTTPELDAKILELMGYSDAGAKVDTTPITVKEIDYVMGDIFEDDVPAFQAAAEAERGVKRYESLLQCLNS